MKRISDPNVQERMNVTGRAIRNARIRAKLSQQELSAKLEMIPVYICRGSLSRIENGSRIVTDIELKAICDVLEIPISQLFEEA